MSQLDERTALQLDADEAREIAAQTYVYGYPLVLMDLTCRAMTSTREPVPAKAPINRFTHMTEFPDPAFKAIVRPNADTLYSVAFLDVSGEPVVLSVPDTGGRYYLMPMFDAWTNVFASPGARTTGTGEGHFAITGPGWSGQLPDAVQQLQAPTSLVWLIGRTQTNGAADYTAVWAIQAGYQLTPLSAWGAPYTSGPGTVDPTVDETTPPPVQVERMDSAEFLSRLAHLMTANPPAAEDAPMLSRMARLGIAPGQTFDASGLDGAVRGAVDQGTADGRESVTRPDAGVMNTANGWSWMAGNIGRYGTDYHMCAYVAWFGLGANLPEDAIYPINGADADGAPLSGAGRYVLRFEPGATPPARAFWSITMYDSEGYFVPNPLQRYAIGDRDSLTVNPDGSLELYIQHGSPGQDREGNWLPAPEGDFNLLMRLYWPEQAMLDGQWRPPPVRRV